jgi:phytoene synthase
VSGEPAGTISADDRDYVTALVRAHDLPRYYATLFSPAALRPDLLAIYGLAAEIARVPDQVREPALGEIRLAWWRDSLAGAVGAGGSGAPALSAAAAAIMRHRLPIAPFEALIEARSADLYSDLPATLNDLEGRLGETESALFQLAAILSGAPAPASAEAAGHAGIAYGIGRRLSRFASERAKGRTILPADLLGGLGLAAADVFAASPPAGIAEAVLALVDVARRHLALACRSVAALPRAARPVFLPLAVVAALLDRVAGAKEAIFMRDVTLSDLSMLTRIGLARLRR